jgi:hypothetical protein
VSEAEGAAWALRYAGLEWDRAETDQGGGSGAGDGSLCRCRLAAVCAAPAGLPDLLAGRPGRRRGCVLELSGKLDASSVLGLQDALEAAGREHGFVAAVLDLSGLDFIDSAGVALLLRLGGRTRDGRPAGRRLREQRPHLPLVALCGAAGQARHSLDLCRVAEALPVAASPREAAGELLLASAGPSPSR